jgi:hypothetical protein
MVWEVFVMSQAMDGGASEAGQSTHGGSTVGGDRAGRIRLAKTSLARGEERDRVCNGFCFYWILSFIEGRRCAPYCYRGAIGVLE